MADTHDEPPFSPSIALVTLSRIVEVQLAGMLEPHGLTLRKYAVLGHIAATPGLSLSDLGRRSRITVQSVHAIIRSLAESGWVRSATEANGLPAQVTVTPAGDALLARLRTEVAEFDRQTFASETWVGLAESLTTVVRERDARGAPPID